MAMDGGGIEYEALTKDDSWRDVQILERQPSRSGFRCACGSRDSRRPRAGEHTRAPFSSLKHPRQSCLHCPFEPSPRIRPPSAPSCPAILMRA